jgi:putative tributyrin esterase
MKSVCNVISYTLGRTVDITVVLPTPTIPDSFAPMQGGPQPHHTPKAKYPVVYLLHGLGNNHATWTGYTNAEFFAEERNIALVMISAENKSYVNHERDKFYDFIQNELPDFATGLFPISGRREDSFIAGLSMGGFGSLVHGLNNPQKYAAIGCFSGAGDINPFAEPFSKEQPPVDDMYVPSKLCEKVGENPTIYPKLYLSCGTKDMLYQKCLAYYKRLRELGADVTWDELPYAHEWRFWNIQIEKFLDWIPRSDAYSKDGHSVQRQI